MAQIISTGKVKKSCYFFFCFYFFFTAFHTPVFVSYVGRLCLIMPVSVKKSRPQSIFECVIWRAAPSAAFARYVTAPCCEQVAPARADVQAEEEATFISFWKHLVSEDVSRSLNCWVKCVVVLPGPPSPRTGHLPLPGYMLPAGNLTIVKCERIWFQSSFCEN